MSRRNPLIVVSALLAFAAAASAQVSTYYTFSQAPGAYVPITGGTLLGAVSGTSGAASLDDSAFAVTLPFAFTFDGAPQTDIYVQTNGWLSFGTTAPSNSYTPLSSTIVAPGIVSACGRDLQGGFVFAADRTLGTDQLVNVTSLGPVQVGDLISGTGIPTGTTVLAITGNTITMSANATSTGTNGAVAAWGPWSELRHETLGTAPNQVFVVQWSNFKRFGSTLGTTQHTALNFQIRLHEATGEIEVVYGDCTPGLSTTTAVHHVGLRGPNNTFATNVNNRTNTKGVNDDWSNSAPGTTNASGMLFNNVAPANVIANGLTYKWTPQSGTPATIANYGAGCGASYASAYQLFTTSAAASAALSNTAIALTNLGSTYAFAAGSATYVTPSATATVLTLGDDAETSVALSAPMPYPGGSTSSLVVCSNGFVSAATGNGTGFTPGGPAFCAMSQAVWGCWHDFNPAETGSGSIKFEEIGGIAYVTWENVESYPPAPTVNPGTMQLQFDVATGNVSIVFGLLDAVGGSSFGDNYLVGYSPIGANVDAGSQNLATTMPFVTAPVDVLPLALSAGPNPALGATMVFTTSNIPATSPLAANLISLFQLNPGVDLGPLGAPGCLDLVNASAAATVLLVPPATTYSIVIPNDASFVGLPINAQAAAFVPGINALGVITSNGVGTVVGNF